MVNYFTNKIKQHMCLECFVTSGNTTSYSSASGVSYTITGNRNGLQFAVIDDDGTGIEADLMTGVLSGGNGVPQGVYELEIKCGNIFGMSETFYLEVNVT